MTDTIWKKFDMSAVLDHITTSEAAGLSTIEAQAVLLLALATMYAGTFKTDSSITLVLDLQVLAELSDYTLGINTSTEDSTTTLVLTPKTDIVEDVTADTGDFMYVTGERGN